MGDQPQKETDVALLELLAEERRALRAGEIDRVLHLGDRKSALAAELQPAATSAATLAAIQAAAARNSALLAASAEGILAAIVRLRDMQSAGGGTTYGPDGRLRSPRPGGLSRRL